ncbi:MAG TPA: aspartate aminotransferase family protein [Candidatus Dormibacteraeota bacterium]|nr:aspartate aminotransferase family protein [Candidatus Dormibacteraeota bacterium]
MTEPMDARETGRRFLSPVMARYFERDWSHGEGHRLFDVDGRSYLDFATGIATTILGHHHPRVSAAVHAQVDRLTHVMNGLGYAEPVSRLAERLVATLPAPLDSVFFGNSGAEAIEGALKLARRASGRPWIVAFEGGFHGRTYGALSVTSSNPNYRAGHGPLLPDVQLLPYPQAYREHGGDEAAATAAALGVVDEFLATGVDPRSVAAFLIEPVLGEGGYVPAPVAFLQGLRERADRHGILLIADEVQTGYGRTGRMWGFEHAGIVPDVVCAAKGIANGLPLGAIVAGRELHERWGKGAHGSTFGGNPVSCAAGLAVLETIAAEDLIGNAAECGTRLQRGLRDLAAGDPRIGDVRGRGLMLGVELIRDRGTLAPDGELADRVIAGCADAGLLLLTCGAAHNVVRWLAPLDVTEAEIDEGLGVFAGVLASS